MAESLRRGDRVIVVGRLRQRSFETREGDKRTVTECDATEVGASLQFRQLKPITGTRGSAQTIDGAGAASSEKPPF